MSLLRIQIAYFTLGLALGIIGTALCFLGGH
jgi:hypothetical protein